MGSGKHVGSFDTPERDCVVIEDTQNTMDKKYSCQVFEPFLMGVGDTPHEAAINLVRSIWKMANRIELASDKYFKLEGQE